MSWIEDDSKFRCSDGEKRTMEEIGILTEKGIKTSIIRKAVRSWRKQIPQDRIYFPRKLTGSKQWCET